MFQRAWRQCTWSAKNAHDRGRCTQLYLCYAAMPYSFVHASNRRSCSRPTDGLMAAAAVAKSAALMGRT